MNTQIKVVVLFLFYAFLLNIFNAEADKNFTFLNDFNNHNCCYFNVGAQNSNNTSIDTSSEDSCYDEFVNVETTFKSKNHSKFLFYYSVKILPELTVKFWRPPQV
jgi:hypothetical protein